MQKRAGLLFLTPKTGRILLILEDSKWTVPTFKREGDLLADATPLVQLLYKKAARILPIELYLSEDKGFEYGTYVCLVEDEFLTQEIKTISWANLDYLPKQLHSGLKSTLSNSIIRSKLDTIIELNKD